MKLRLFSLLGGLALALVSCTSQTGPTGFLQDYSKLKPGPYFADLAWVAPDANFPRYDAIIIDPVVMFGERAAALPADERNNLGTTLRNSFVQRMSDRFRIVSAPGPKTLRLRLAIADLEAANPVLNTPTSILPPARVASEAQRLVTGTQSFAGSAALEAEFLDSATGRQLAAGVDRQFGKKRIGTAPLKWGEVKKIFDTWAVEMTNNLVAHQRGPRPSLRIRTAGRRSDRTTRSPRTPARRGGIAPRW